MRHDETLPGGDKRVTKMMKKMTHAEKVKLYEVVLNDIAVWNEETLAHCDEPGAAESGP
jgi:hypothetical protein